MNWLTDNFRVAVLPLATQLADKETNLEAVAAAFGHLPEECDMVVLPELFSTTSCAKWPSATPARQSTL